MGRAAPALTTRAGATRYHPAVERLCWIWLVVVALVGCASGDTATLPVSVSAPTGTLAEPLTVETTWRGEAVQEALAATVTSDGHTVHHGILQGPPVRLLAVGLRGGEDGETLYQGLVIVRGGEGLHLALDPDVDGRLRRVPTAGTVTDAVQGLEGSVGLRMLWAVVALILVGVLVGRGRLPRRFPTPRWRPGWDGLAWLGIGVALTWPAALAGPELLVGRHFDLPGTVWVLDALPRLLSHGLTDPLTGLPGGAELRALDSFTLAPLGVLGAWIHPARLHGLLQVGGVMASGWAATAAARAMGARGGLAMIAGLSFAASGMAASTLLEGHVYHLLNPWLPLFTWAWWRTTRPGARWVHGAVAGLAFGLAAATTGYLALAAAVILIALGIAAGLRRPWPAPLPMAAALATAAPLVAGVAWTLVGRDAGFTGDASALATGQTTLLGLAGGSLHGDLLGHSHGPAPLPTVLALAAFAPVALRREAGWAGLGLAAVLGLALSFGPKWAVAVHGAGLPSPFAGLWDLPGGPLLRFPVRLGWAWLLCTGVLGALVASRLRLSRGAQAVLWIALAIDVVCFVGIPQRQVGLAGGGPASGWASPTFDLLPEGFEGGGDGDAWLSALACLDQVEHGMGIAEDCVRVPVRDNPRFRLGRALTPALLAGDVGGAAAVLREAGFRSVLWRPDLFGAATRRRLAASLRAMDPAPEVHRSAAGQVWVVAVGDGEDAGDTGFRGVSGAPDLERLDLRLRVVSGLATPRRLRAVLRTGRQPVSQELSRVSALPDDWPGDLQWRARWVDPGPGPYTLSVYEDGVDHSPPLWSGPLEPAGAVDEVELDLTLTPAGTLSLRPAAFAPALTGLGLQHRGGLIAGVGWGIWVAVWLGLLFWARRGANQVRAQVDPLGPPRP